MSQYKQRPMVDQGTIGLVAVALLAVEGARKPAQMVLAERILAHALEHLLENEREVAEEKTRRANEKETKP